MKESRCGTQSQSATWKEKRVETSLKPVRLLMDACRSRLILRTNKTEVKALHSDRKHAGYRQNLTQDTCS